MLSVWPHVEDPGGTLLLSVEDYDSSRYKDKGIMNGLDCLILEAAVVIRNHHRNRHQEHPQTGPPIPSKNYNHPPLSV
ncbi:unnamed protein product [Absidia cylindrospora]